MEVRENPFDLGDWLTGQRTNKGEGVYDGHSQLGGTDPYQLLSHGRQNQAATAIAAAAAAGPLPKKTKLCCNGRFLRRPEDHYDVDQETSIGGAPQLQVSPITMLKSEPKLRLVQQIAVDSTYITYGLKQGHIRVINQHTANRNLFKGHTTPVVDMAFYNLATSVLASASDDGDVWVRRIYEDVDDAPIKEEVLFRHQLPISPQVVRRLCWHPTCESMLLVAADTLAFCFVPRGGLGVVVATTNFVVSSASVTCGQLTAVSFNTDGSLLAVSDSLGQVQIWDFPVDVSVSNIEEFAVRMGEPLVRFSAFDNGIVSSLVFLVSERTNARLMVGNDVNSVLKVWNVAPNSTPVETQIVHLKSGVGEQLFFNHLTWQPTLQLVVLANTRKQQVYVLHYMCTATGCAYFDYISDFSVQQPILSMTTTPELGRSADGSELFHLYCIQTEAIQQYTLDYAACYPAVDACEDQGEGVAVLAQASGPPASAPVVPPAVPDVIPSVLTEHIRQHSLESSKALSGDGLDLQQPAAQGTRDIPLPEHIPTPLRLLTPGLLKEQVEKERLDSPLQAGVVSKEIPSFLSAPMHAPVLPTEAEFTSATEALKVDSTQQELDILSVATSTPYNASPPAEQLSSSGSTEPDVNEVENSEQPYVDANTSVGLNSSHPGPSADYNPVVLDHIAGLLSQILEVSQSNALVRSDLQLVAATQQQMMETLLAIQREQKESVKNIKTEFSRLLKQTEANITKSVDGLKTYVRKTDEDRKKQAVQEREELHKLFADVTSSMSKDLAQIIQENGNNNVATTVNALVSNMKVSLQELLPAYLQSGVLQSCLDAAVGSQVKAALPKPISEGLRDNFQSTVIPAFERATQAMFAQIETAFETGLSEHLKRASGATADIAVSLKDSVGQISNIAQTMKSELLDGQRQLVSALNGPVLTQLRADKTADSSTKAVTLAEIEARQDPKVLITNYLKSGNYEDAYSKALGLSDISTVVWLCRQLDPSSLLAKEPFPLSQYVLLSLLQQLGYDLKSDTDLKIRWIVEIATNLNPRDSPIAGHIKPILQQVMTNLVGLSATGEVAKSSRLAVHLVNSLLHQ